MISYCVAVYRPVYARLLIADLVRKTSSPFEVLVWINVADPEFEAFIDDGLRDGWPLVVVGRTPHNIGMCAYAELFRAATHQLVVQIDDDVLCVSRGIAERAAAIFSAYPDVRQIVADVWQDEHTTGARPPLSHYCCVDADHGLYDGPIDGWFSIYHRSILPLVLSLQITRYCYIGAAVRSTLLRRQQRGLLCTRMKVFHATGPAYASLFGMLDFEIEKYRGLGRTDIVNWYTTTCSTPVAEMASRFAAARASLDSPGL
jgi:hypothetical protein